MDFPVMTPLNGCALPADPQNVSADSSQWMCFVSRPPRRSSLLFQFFGNELGPLFELAVLDSSHEFRGQRRHGSWRGGGPDGSAGYRWLRDETKVTGLRVPMVCCS